MRTVRARLTGLAGLVGILLVVVGTPTALLAIGATPVPDQIPTWQEIWAKLTGVDDGTFMLATFRVVAWGAWAYLTLGLLFEVASRARGIRAPRIRGLGLSQALGKSLVSAALLLFTAVPAATLPAGPAAAVEPVVATAPLAPASGGADASALTAAQVATRSAATPTPPVEPPATVHTVRPGETLWSLAERYLGDGARYREIATANYGAAQPDGARLTDSHWIRPGWHLTIPTLTDPTPGEGVREYTVQRGDTLWDIADDELGDPARYGEIYTASTAITQPGGHHLSDPDEISPGWTLHLPAPATPDPERATDPTPDATASDAPPVAVETPAATPADTVSPSTEPAPAGAVETHAAQDGGRNAQETAADEVVEAGAWPVRTAAGAGSLLAAGLVALIAARRAALARRRRPGQPTPMPTGEAADVEHALRVAADPLGVEAVDTALRSLARDRARAGQPLPILRWARLAPAQLDLHLAEPATLPAPWTGTTDALTWSLHVEDTTDLDPAALATVPAPYPALVTLGHDLHDGHILIDLEHVGALTVTGPADRTRQVLAALAVELATSGWADDLHVTTVLDHVGLEEALRTGRITYQPSIGYLLDDLTERAAADRAALAAAGVTGLPEARITRAAPDAWTPDVLLVTCALTARHRNLLSALVEEQPRVAIAAVTTDDPITPWVLTLDDTDPGTAVLEPLALRLRPQHLDPVVYDHLLHLARPVPADPAGTPNAVGTAAHHEPTGTVTGEGPTTGGGPAPLTNPPELRRHTGDGGDGPGAGGGGQGAETLTTQGGATSSAGNIDKDDDLDDNDGDDEGGDPEAAQTRSDLPAPYIRVLGPVTVEHACGRVEQSRQARLSEYAAYLALFPGATAGAIDDAIWPGRRSEDNDATRHTTTSKLRAWFGKADHGDYLPAHQGGRFAFRPDVRTDWDDWRALLPDGPLPAATDNLDQALALVRGRPFEGSHRSRYAWAEPLRQQMTDQIVDAAHELARRRAREGNWRAAEAAVLTGLTIDPALERLWRLRILAAHVTAPTTTAAEAIQRMLTITNDLGGDLEPETEALLAAIEDDADLDDLTAIAL